MGIKDFSLGLPEYNLPSQSKWQRPAHNRIVEVFKTWALIEILPGIQIKVDVEDVPTVMKHRWHIDNDPRYSRIRIQTNLVVGKCCYKKTSLPKLILNPPGHLIAKLIDPGDQFNFRRNNIEAITAQAQSRKCRKRKETSSIYRGVSYRSKRDKWAAMIQIDKGKHLLIGYFDCEHEAASAWNKASEKYFGKDGYRNIIEDRKLARKGRR